MEIMLKQLGQKFTKTYVDTFICINFLRIVLFKSFQFPSFFHHVPTVGRIDDFFRISPNHKFGLQKAYSRIKTYLCTF